MFEVVRAAIIVKNHWKEIVIGLLVLLLLPLMFISMFTNLSTVPLVNDKIMGIYKQAAENAGKGKVDIDFRPLIAIDAVRLKQDFSKASISEAQDLANKFIKEEKKEIRYDFTNYVNITSKVNSDNKINIDWRDVVTLDSIISGTEINTSANTVTDLVKKFVRQDQVKETYTVYENRTKKVPYKVWEYYSFYLELVEEFPWVDWTLFFDESERGHWITKYTTVTETVPVEKVRYKTVISANSLDAVLKENNYNSSKIPDKFKNKNDITVNMLNRYETIYTVKDFEAVLNELKFTQEEKDRAYMYMKTGVNGLMGASNIDLDGTSGQKYTIPRFYQYDIRWGANSYGYGTTIKESGCGPTSFAMVVTGMNAKNLKFLDKNMDGIVDPGEAAQYSLAHGYRAEGQGTSWNFFTEVGKAVGLDVQQLGKTQAVYEALKSGYPVIASMTKGHFTSSGHFIVLTGLDRNGKVIVNDPFSEARSNETWDFNSVILMEAVQFWVFKKPLGQGESYQLTGYTGDPSENGGGAGRMGADGKTDLWKANVSNRYIAVSKSNIKLGQKVYIEFPQAKRFVKMPDGSNFDLNGVYLAVDTGGAITDHKLDLYTGFDGVNVKGNWYHMAMDIGRINVNVYKDY